MWREVTAFIESTKDRDTIPGANLEVIWSQVDHLICRLPFFHA